MAATQNSNIIWASRRSGKRGYGVMGAYPGVYRVSGSGCGLSVVMGVVGVGESI